MQENSRLCVKTFSICSEIKYKEKKVASESIRYPEFYPGYALQNDNSIINLAKKMSLFYKSAAERLSAYAHKTLAKKAYSKAKKSPDTKPFRVCMNCTVSYCSEHFVSVITDVTSFDGQKTQSERISHNWSIEKACVLPASYFLNTSHTSKKFIESYISDAVMRNMKNPFFGYYGDAQKSAVHHFSLSNFYFVPKGAAFYINPGILCDAKYGPSVFVIPFTAADGIFKVTEKLSDNILPKP